MFTSIAVVLVGIWLILVSQGPVNDTLTLVLGVAVAVLALIDILQGRGVLVQRSPPA